MPTGDQGATRDLEEENRSLRERVAELQKALLAEHGDPVLRALLEHAPGFTHVITPEGRVLAAGRTNPAFGSIVGRSIFEFMAPDEQAKVRTVLARAAATKEPTWFECVSFGEDGEPGHCYRARAIPLRDPEAAGAILVIPTDITDHVRLERSLLDSKESLRLAVDASRIGLWRWDAQRNVVEWDARVCEIAGVTEPPPSFDAYLDVVHPEDRSLLRSVVAEALETGVFRTFEHRLVPRREDEERWVLCVGSVDLGEGRQVLGLRGGVLDITDKKLLARQLQRAERVQTVGELSAGVAHNFNNLLAAIIPNLEVVKAGADPSLQAAVTAALDASLQARDLVKSMLALAGRRASDPAEPANVRDVIARVESICRMTFPREITLVSRVADDVGFVTMRATDLEQVLLNLLFNARDAIEESNRPLRRIDLVAERLVSAGQPPSIRIRVTDTGGGIPDAVRGRLFEPFFTTKSPHRGTGLGLPTALARARDAGGQLGCERTSEEGTTFSLVLPGAEAPGPVAAEPPPQASMEQKTVLLVDDEPLVRQAVKRLLELDGYRVIEAASAAQARHLLAGSPAAIDAILLDQSMPLESGLEAAPSIRALCPAPIILFTGLAPDLTPGIAAVLEKPATSEDVLCVVRQVLEKRPGAPEELLRSPSR